MKCTRVASEESAARRHPVPASPPSSWSSSSSDPRRFRSPQIPTSASPRSPPSPISSPRYQTVPSPPRAISHLPTPCLIPPRPLRSPPPRLRELRNPRERTGPTSSRPCVGIGYQKPLDTDSPPNYETELDGNVNISLSRNEL